MRELLPAMPIMPVLLHSITLTAAYGTAIGFGFLLSPVVQSLGVGLFGREFGWQFGATVLTAHAAFGVMMGLLLKRSARTNAACQLSLGRWKRSLREFERELTWPSGRARYTSAHARNQMFEPPA